MRSCLHAWSGPWSNLRGVDVPGNSGLEAGPIDGGRGYGEPRVAEPRQHRLGVGFRNGDEQGWITEARGPACGRPQEGSPGGDLAEREARKGGADQLGAVVPAKSLGPTSVLHAPPRGARGVKEPGRGELRA